MKARDKNQPIGHVRNNILYRPGGVEGREVIRQEQQNTVPEQGVNRESYYRILETKQKPMRMINSNSNDDDDDDTTTDTTATAKTTKDQHDIFSPGGAGTKFQVPGIWQHQEHRIMNTT